jgi:hypothetical protein
MDNKYKTLETIIKEMSANAPLLNGVDWRYSRVCSTIRNLYNEQREKIEKHERDQLAVGTYFTKNFEMSPKAQLLYAKLPKNTDPVSAEKSAILHDKLFALEKQSQATQSASKQTIDSAEDYVQQIKMHAKKMGLEKEHLYIDTNLNNIKKYAGKVPDVPMASDDEEVEKIKAKTSSSPPFQRNPEPIKDMDLDSKDFLIRRNLAAQRKIKIIDGD